MTDKKITIQPASEDIWDKKYRLKDKQGVPIDTDIDATYQRVARALSDVEEPSKRDHWNERFLWAMRHGAIPAGRITSNAGAQEYKASTSLINCTVSGTVHDSMDDIMQKAHEAALTLKAGCVAPGTLVLTEKGLVAVEKAVLEKHEKIMSYDKEKQIFEMKKIEKHLTTHVPKSENIEIIAGDVSLRTSIKHPVLIFRNEKIQYVRADEVKTTDAIVRYSFDWAACKEKAMEAWFVGAHLGDGSSYPKKEFQYKETRKVFAEKAALLGRRLVFKIRAAEKEVVEKYAEFFKIFAGSNAVVMALQTENGTNVWDYCVSSYEATRAELLFDSQIGKKTSNLKVPAWIKTNPQKYFIPFLAGLIDTDGTVSKERGSASISAKNIDFLNEIKALLAFFGVHGGLTKIKPYSHTYKNILINSDGHGVLKISDSDFLKIVATFMADSGKRSRIYDYASKSGQYDKYIMTQSLQQALSDESIKISHLERQSMGFYHGRHKTLEVNRINLDRWEKRFPHLREEILKVKQLRIVNSISRNLDLPETFFDFTVEKNNNYLAGNNGLVVIHNCGIGYAFSTLRPKGGYVAGAGSTTSGPMSFMDIFDKMCFTVSSAGGRRGAQMGTFDISHPDVKDFILAKRENGRLRQFNLSLLITDEFMKAVESNDMWPLVFPVHPKEKDEVNLNDPSQVLWREWETKEGYITREDGLVACKVYQTIKARNLWDLIMSSTYDYAEPGFILIDRANEMNNNWWMENFRATNPCGEQVLPPYGSCLLGSINLTLFVRDAFTDKARFDWDLYREVIGVFTRMLDNVVELNGLPLPQQRHEIMTKRRHGMGFLGLGSALTMMKTPYGSPESVVFTEEVSKILAVAGWEESLKLAKEKGPAPALDQNYSVTHEMLRKRPEMVRDGWKVGQDIRGAELHARYSRYMQKIAEVAPELVEELALVGARFTHHSSIAPTGTISLSLANNASNGIEPSFAHSYSRNVIREGKKSKEKIEVLSFELLAYRTLVNPNAKPYAEEEDAKLPDYFIAADQVTPKQHVDIQAASQKWIDSSISKTANVPTNYPYQDFKDIYTYAYQKGLKGCTTFRFNPEVFQGVLVNETDLANTTYKFTLEDGSTIELKGNDDVEYDGETHSAANLYDALKEGYYGKF